ncbi:site-specific DNA-methyltransferase [Rhodovulum sulfidophilum]|uniref:Methyltransferase n=1 Tax=Rhodovulum visakhapatnamense TaxID=364297 RepID=A0ABS1RMI4_9RHOB|nr:site-specific DNA-methyltransferase [Rhodovulum visakhapatnamense]MBL3572065.1 site-specific DNA-methyltransferase [Rhodovulum visakhapatnamense]MBL3580730.1 site-specific DNA-methyltransferase [Rhodovulum visakhapatnamense]OLS43021.1 site-specific DNA-methyltransferase [Rhodovulum sulfidophilum]
MSIAIHHGNCLALLDDVPPESVDAIITDPPYGQTSLEWDRWVDGWPEVMARVLKPTGSMWVFGTLRMFMDRRDEFSGWKFAQDIVWEKHNGSSFHSDRFRRVHEQAAQFYRGEWGSVWKGKVVTMDAARRTVTRKKGRPAHMGIIEGATYTSEDGGPRIMRSVIYARSQHGRAIHPTQKPEAIVEPLILNACPPGGVVLDPFAGSGTTGAVAARLGRRAILIEGRNDYVSALRARFSGDLLLAGGAA